MKLLPTNLFNNFPIAGQNDTIVLNCRLLSVKPVDGFETEFAPSLKLFCHPPMNVREPSIY